MKTFIAENKKLIKKGLIFIGSAVVVLGGLVLAGKVKDGVFEDDSVDIYEDENGGVHIIPVEKSNMTEEEG